MGPRLTLASPHKGDDMSTAAGASPGHPGHGQIGFLQLPARDVAASAAFYRSLFGWEADLEHGSFRAPGMFGHWTTELEPAASGGPVLWIWVDQLWPALHRVATAGGAVRGRPWLDQGERWLVELSDPAGNRIGLVAPARTAQSQPMLAVRDVELSSRWYQDLVGLVSDHGGPEYERLLADGVLVLQLHKLEVEHHHGQIADPDATVGNGVLVWLGEVADFDAVVARADRLQAPVVRPPHRNPPEGQGNGPSHREIWLRDPDGYTVVVASPDGEAWESGPRPLEE
jgi:predicted enzyme related to lactoylglutathione lyase